MSDLTCAGCYLISKRAYRDIKYIIGKSTEQLQFGIKITCTEETGKGYGNYIHPFVIFMFCTSPNLKLINYKHNE